MDAPLHNRRYHLLLQFAQIHEDLDTGSFSYDRRRRMQDRAWNLLQDIKEVTISLNAQQVPPPAQPPACAVQTSEAPAEG